MKNINFPYRLPFTVYLLICSLLLFSFPSFSQTEETWDYPIKPRTEKWNTLSNVKERKDACQIDKDKLPKLSTKKIVEIIMEHPYFLTYGYSNNLMYGMKAAMYDFNGFIEIQNRQNGAKVLIDMYEKEDFYKIKSIDDIAKRGEYSLKWIGLEMLLCDDKLLSQLSRLEKIKFLKSLKIKNLHKKNLIEDFGGFGESSTAYLANAILKSIDASLITTTDPTSYKLFQQDMLVRNPKVIDDIINSLNEFISHN